MAEFALKMGPHFRWQVHSFVAMPILLRSGFSGGLYHGSVKKNRKSAAKETNFFDAVHRRRIFALSISTPQRGGHFLSAAPPRGFESSLPVIRIPKRVVVGGAPFRRFEIIPRSRNPADED